MSSLQTIAGAKSRLRRKFLRLLKGLPVQERQRRSRYVEDTLSALPLFSRANRIMGFYPLTGELDLRRMLRRVLQEKQLFLPVIDEQTNMLVPCPVRQMEHLIDGPYCTKQPQSVPGCAGSDVLPEVVLVPGLAFTPQGDRLGRGKGFYDRFLATLPPEVTAIGVCFSSQLVNTLPTHSSRDQRVHFVIAG